VWSFLNKPNHRFALIFLWKTLKIRTELFQVFLGDPFTMEVNTTCPEQALDPCGKVGAPLLGEFRVFSRDAARNCLPDFDILVRVSIPVAFITPPRVGILALQGGIEKRSLNGTATFLPGTSRIDKLPPNPEIGYKLQFDAISSSFPSIAPGYSAFFTIEPEVATDIAFSSPIANGSIFYVFSCPCEARRIYTD
jgi:hypothetical protein